MRWVVTVLGTVFISGCWWNQHPVDTSFSTYTSRISNVQQSPDITLPGNALVALPEKRQLMLEAPDIPFGFLDSYELRKCDLFNLIAEKNSILGKVQDAFRNLDYQTQLVAGLSRCLASSEISEEMKAELKVVLDAKQRQLPAHFNNLVFVSQEMRTQLNGSSWIATDMSSLSAELKQGLQAVSKTHQAISRSQVESSDTVLTDYQEVIEKQPLVGSLSYSMQNASSKLSAITQQLEQYDAAIVCGVGRNDTKFKTLRNVFQLYYVEQLQPYFAKLDRLYFQVSSQLDFVRNANADYTYPIDPLHTEFRQAIADHVNYWKTLFKRCGASPTRN
ncbi:hypothetical protein NL53_00500 [Vibrio variabilis]|uniref:DUF3080 domain-containing protein n=1 Tax=Vibrio variabilis TaxID=990271 RepID=A0ABR4YHS8_9VIBR|nr:DUF3080 family protein [Vibrio variabilis]KHA62572.1 hypothetical protein NL53_00500 [Vibrio variabilis]